MQLRSEVQGPFRREGRRRYRTISPMGARGLGEASLALMDDDGGGETPVVIERPWPSQARHDRCREAFLTEARLSLRLDHPNILRCHELGCDAEGYYLAREHLDGESLDAALERTRRALPLPLALKVVTDLLAGLDYLHGLTDLEGRPLGLIHGDLSPRNVLLTYDGMVKLIDTGGARRQAAAFPSQAPWGGRLAYLAPEQVQGGLVDHRADLFSVGVILWELVARRRLWEGLSHAELTARLLSGAPAPPLPVATDLGPDLVEICARALSMDPRHRQPSAVALQAELDQVLTRGDVSARHLGAFLGRTCGESRAELRALIDRRTPPEGLPVVAEPPAPPPATPTRPPRAATARPRGWIAAGVGRGAAIGLAVAVAGAVALGARPRSSARLLAAAPAASVRSSVAIWEPVDTPPPPAARPRPDARKPARPNQPDESVQQAIADGRRALEEGQLLSADQILRKAVLLASANAEAAATLAEVRFELARYQEAFELARRAARLAPSRASYQVLLGDAASRLGLVAEAAAAYARAQALEPDNAGVRERLERLAARSHPAPDIERSLQ
jgi:serine/threonine-protein kinase